MGRNWKPEVREEVILGPRGVWDKGEWIFLTVERQCFLSSCPFKLSLSSGLRQEDSYRKFLIGAN